MELQVFPLTCAVSRLFTSLTSDPCPVSVYLLCTTSPTSFPSSPPALFLQVVCGQNCTFVIQPNGTVLACGEGSYGRLGQGNSDDLHVLTVISALQGAAEISAVLTKRTVRRAESLFVCLKERCVYMCVL